MGSGWLTGNNEVQNRLAFWCLGSRGRDLYWPHSSRLKRACRGLGRQGQGLSTQEYASLIKGHAQKPKAKSKRRAVTSFARGRGFCLLASEPPKQNAGWGQCFSSEV